MARGLPVLMRRATLSALDRTRDDGGAGGASRSTVLRGRVETIMTNTSARSDVYVGAAGSNSGARGGIFRRTVGNGGWTALTEGLPEASHVQAITVHPTNPDIIYLGTRSGPYRSTNRGERWERLPFPDDGTEVWEGKALPRSEEHTSELQSHVNIVC